MIIVGHRGACGYTDENTLDSFQKALDLKCTDIELDVYQCSSGELIIHHDIILDNLTNGSGFIEDKTLSQIKKIKTKNGHSIPTLNEVLDLIDRKSRVHIEIKSHNSSNQVAQKIQEYVSKHKWNFDNFLVCSFLHKELLNFRNILPEVGIGVLIGHLPLNTNFLDEFAPYCVSLDSEFISEDIIKSTHSKGIKVFAYTINTQCEYNALKSLGIDGIYSNFPDKLK